MSRFPRVFVFGHEVMHQADDLAHELFAYLICAADLWNQLLASSQSGVYVRSRATYLFFFWSNFVSYFSRSFFNLYGTGPRIWTLTKEVGAPCATITLVRYLWWVMVLFRIFPNKTISSFTFTLTYICNMWRCPSTCFSNFI